MAELFSQPTRQSPIAIVFILGTVFKTLFRQLWLLIVVFILNPKKRSFDNFTFIFIGLAAVGALMSVINYFFHYFYIKDGELVMTKGVIRKSRLNIPLDRIQSVNFRQGVLHQAFDVVSVEIDSAGASGKEFALQAISKQQAEALRELVEGSRQSAVGSPQSAVGSGGQSAVGSGHLGEGEEGHGVGEWAMENTPFAMAIQPKLLFRLHLSDLLKIGISQNHLRTTGIIMAFFFSFADNLSEALDIKFSQKIQQILQTATQSDYVMYALLILPIFLILSFLGTLSSTVLRYFDLQFWRTERGFKMVSGLFTRQETSANLNKVQYVMWTTTPLKRFFAMASVRIPQAASVEVSRKLSVHLPGCYVPGLDAIREAYFPEEKQLPTEAHGVEKAIVRRQFMQQGVFPVLVLAIFIYNLTGMFAWWLLLWLLPAWWLSTEYHKRWHWQISIEGLLAGWGVFTRHQVLLQWYKVEAVRLTQSVFQRRAGIANLVLFTAAGSVSIPYLPLDKARALLNFVLFKVETNHSKWM